MKRVKFNGPSRLNNAKSLAEDMKMLKVMLKPNQSKSNHASRAADVIEQLPNTISVSFQNLIGHELVAALSQDIACSAGSACHAAPAGGHVSSVHYAMSDVLQAMSVDKDFGLGTLRLSLGRHTSADDIDKAVPLIATVIKRAWNIEN
jgi:cysteine desulfurase